MNTNLFTSKPILKEGNLSASHHFPNENILFEVHSFQCTNHYNFPFGGDKRGRNTYEIIWVRSGVGTLLIDLQEYEINDRKVYCINPGQYLQLNPNSVIDGYYISLSSEFLYGVGSGFEFSFLNGRHETTRKAAVIEMDEEMKDELEEILIKMRKEFLHHSSFRSEILRGLFKIFLLYLSRRLTVTEYPVAYSRDKELVSKFLRLLGKHYATKKMVADYANDLNVTPSYLNQVVKKVSGFTASYHIQQQLIEEAKKQAIHSSQSMKQIAYGLGFDDIAHFSKFFKTNSGINFTNFKKGLISSMNISPTNQMSVSF